MLSPRLAALVALALPWAPAPPATRPAAPVTVVEFSDFRCHYCGDFARTVHPVVEREFVATGRVRWRLVPLANASAPHALEAAAALECASRDGRMWAMDDALFAGRAEWLRDRDPARRFAGYARAVGLDPGRFAACYRDPATLAAVQAQRALARDVGVRISPTLLVNGRRVEGAVSIDEVRAVIREALAGA